MSASHRHSHDPAPAAPGHSHGGHAHDDHAHTPHAHHSHPVGVRHPAAAVAPSLLRLSALARLMLVLPVAALLWAAALAVLWGGA